MSARCLRCGAGNEWIEGNATHRARATEAGSAADAIETETLSRRVRVLEGALRESIAITNEAPDISKPDGLRLWQGDALDRINDVMLRALASSPCDAPEPNEPTGGVRG